MRPVDLVLERVLPAGADLADADRAAGPVLEAEQDRGRVLGGDLARDGLVGPLQGEGLHGAGGLLANLDECRQVRHDRHDRLPGDERREIQPVRADVADGAEGPAALGLEAPVPVGLEEEPILEVAAGHQADVADLATSHELVGVLVERVVADVEVHGVDEPAGFGRLDQLVRFDRGHAQGLFADDMLAGRERSLRLADVQVIGRGDVDDIDARILEERLDRRIGVRDTQRVRTGGATLRGAAKHATDLDADRRSASTWTVPMKPVPMTAVPIPAIFFILGAHLLAGDGHVV